jgi:predicted permease
MWRLRRFARRLLDFARPGRADAALSREIAAHLALAEDEFRRKGMTPEDARLAAMRAFGGVPQAMEIHRDARSFAWLDDARRDLRHAARLLRRTPVFALTASLSLAIGIGATTTIFTVVNALLLRAPLGVSDQDRLVDIYNVEEGNPFAGPAVPYPVSLDIPRFATTLEGVYAYQLEVQPISLRVSGAAERVFSNVVTPNYFTVLGVPPAAGRVFTPGDAGEKDEAIVVLSHRFWRRRFNGDPAIVGQPLWLNSRPFMVVGVASETFRGTSVVAPDLWIPAGAVPVLVPGSSVSAMQVLIGARLKPRVSLTQAASEVDVIGRAIYAKGRPLERFGRGGWTQVRPGLGMPSASPIPGNLRRLVGGFFALLMVLVSIVLVIACANISGVLLARGSARRLEIAVRLAIGAGRARLIRQLLTETMVLFVLGGSAGLLLARP